MTIGLVYAMPGEIETLLTDETRTPIRTEAGVSFYQIRPHIIACCCGVSKVNAAMGAQLLISLYHPDLVLNAGVAGCFVNVPIGTIVLAEGFALGEYFLRDAAVGRESVEYDEQSLHGTLFSGPQACGEFFEIVRSAQLEVSQPDDEGGGTFRRQRRQVRRRCGEQPCDAGQRQREDRREQQRL